MSMTTEQREAIDRLSSLLKKGKYGVAGKTLLYEDYYMLKNVLEVVENQERKIIKQQEKIEKRDKIIDLMAELVYKRFKAELLLEYGFENEEQLKQYFADLVEKETKET